MANAPIKHAVNAKLDGGEFVACTAGSDGCTKFEIGDINALEAEVYVDGDSSFIGARCDTAATTVKRDANGRIRRPAAAASTRARCSSSPAARMKKQHLPFAIDAQNDFNTDQIWNQPAYRYTVNRFQALTPAQAANLVVHGTHGRRRDELSVQRRRPRASRSSTSDAALGVGARPEHRRWSRASSRRARRAWSPCIELDKEPSDDTAAILGGEYVDDASVGADRLTVPPFLWVIHDAGSDDEGTSADGDGHNPYVKPSLVKQLIALGQQ